MCTIPAAQSVNKSTQCRAIKLPGIECSRRVYKREVEGAQTSKKTTARPVHEEVGGR